MYLNQVLNDIQKESAPPKALNAEHLYKMNEAVFNLPEEDVIDSKMSTKLFQAITKIRAAYNVGKIRDADHNFFYDYVALLGTLQNQHFFSGTQTDKLLAWIKEAIDFASGGGTPAVKEVAPANTKADEKRLKKLEEDNKRLKEELEQLKAISGAVQVIKSFKYESAAPEPKAKAKAKSGGRKKGEEEDGGEDAGGGVVEEGKEKKAKGKAKVKPKAKWKAKESTEG